MRDIDALDCSFVVVIAFYLINFWGFQQLHQHVGSCFLSNTKQRHEVMSRGMETKCEVNMLGWWWRRGRTSHYSSSLAKMERVYDEQHKDEFSMKNQKLCSYICFLLILFVVVRVVFAAPGVCCCCCCCCVCDFQKSFERVWVWSSLLVKYLFKDCDNHVLDGLTLCSTKKNNKSNNNKNIKYLTTNKGKYFLFMYKDE